MRGSSFWLLSYSLLELPRTLLWIPAFAGMTKEPVNSKAVILAHVGIQLLAFESLGFKTPKTLLWIPACAGMTKEPVNNKVVILANDCMVKFVPYKI
ncbi:hypothetical protein [Shewanella putrefaciens]|uniref:Uncharacterized protein n=1 Tax=Shewanella putrefaciens TaxID=24 RepID=A0ABX8X8V3_SHEPU|nr:hypothetical protein [Shewanella putrefaciens]MCT8945133.1 hypothetical protein [Shewanella putrefaciens]QSE48221.1 hypothetical protein JW975_12675 [Shewanella putrefaciens]QYX71626.1 hypothetical protein K3G22_12660 [Shewanella putrefaciens]GGN27241.1 hypothetical protein GCM10007984_30470 [Shewanella putrefaciens]